MTTAHSTPALILALVAGCTQPTVSQDAAVSGSACGAKATRLHDPGTELEWAPPAPIAVAEPVDPPAAPFDMVERVVDIVNAELAYLGHEERAYEVPTYQVPAARIADLYGSDGPVYGLYRDHEVWIGQGTFCGVPDDYDGRVLGAVLAHEYVHVAGFHHSEMYEITTGTWARIVVECGIDAAPWLESWIADRGL